MKQYVDYSKEITIADLDIPHYDEKFKFVDDIKSMKNPHPKYLAKIWSDPTMFSYHLFRLDGQPLRLYAYQDLLLNDTHQLKISRQARQTGKSLSLDVKAAYNFVRDHGYGHNECIISKSLPQAKYQMMRVKALLNSAKFTWHDHKGSTDSMMIISLDWPDETDSGWSKQGRPQRIKYTNLFMCVPATEGSLGYSFHNVNLDEFEYWQDDLEYMFYRIIEPTTYKTKGKISIFSSPNGSNNLVARLEALKDADGKPLWHTYVFSFLDCPGNTKEEFEQKRISLSRHDFESNVLALRTTSDASYFTPEEVGRSCSKGLSAMAMVGKQPFFFLDIGAKHDQSCLIGGFVEFDKDTEFNHLYIPIIHLYPVGYPLSRVAGMQVDESDGWHYERSVKEYLQDWTDQEHGLVPVFGFDVTGNEGMKALFEQMGIEAQDITFSGPSKSTMYQRFKYLMEKGLLHRIPHPQWEKQALDVIVSKSARGYLLINAASVTKQSFARTLDAKLKRIADDCLDATAGFIMLADPVGDLDIPSIEVI